MTHLGMLGLPQHILAGVMQACQPYKLLLILDLVPDHVLECSFY